MEKPFNHITKVSIVSSQYQTSICITTTYITNSSSHSPYFHCIYYHFPSITSSQHYCIHCQATWFKATSINQQQFDSQVLFIMWRQVQMSLLQLTVADHCNFISIQLSHSLSPSYFITSFISIMVFFFGSPITYSGPRLMEVTLMTIWVYELTSIYTIYRNVTSKVEN